MITFEYAHGCDTYVFKNRETVGYISSGKVVFLNTPATRLGLSGEDCRQIAQQLDYCCQYLHSGVMSD